MQRLSGCKCQENHGSGRDEEASAAQERDGFHREGEAAEPLLHRHPQHHPGRGGPHTGRNAEPPSSSPLPWRRQLLHH